MSLGSDCASVPLVANMGGFGGNNNGGFFGNEGLWAVIILAIIFGWGRNGFGGNNDGGNNGGTPYVINAGGFGGGSGALTRGDLCMDMNFSDLENGVRGLQASVSDGFHGIDNAVCTLGYQNAQLINGLERSVAAGFHGVDNAICNQSFQIERGISGLASQLASCCCDLRSGIQASTTQGIMNTNAIQNQIQQCCCAAEKDSMQTRFDMAQMNCSTLQAIDKVGDRIIDYMAQEKTQALRDELQTARLAASQAKQNEYLVNQLRPCPSPAYITCNPWASQAPYGSCGCGCGCNG